MKKFIFYIFIIIFIYSLLPSTIKAEDPTLLIKIPTSHKTCPHGLHSQPYNGPFSVFIFCDDAGGTNIGIIHSQPGARHWQLHDRFWQEKEWASDITSFLWAFSSAYAYVATQAIYGNGGIFKLNLESRTYEEIILSGLGKIKRSEFEHSTEIESYDIDKRIMRVVMHLYNHKTKESLTIKEDIKFE